MPYNRTADQESLIITLLAVISGVTVAVLVVLTLVLTILYGK